MALLVTPWTMRKRSSGECPYAPLLLIMTFFVAGIVLVLVSVRVLQRLLKTFRLFPQDLPNNHKRSGNFAKGCVWLSGMGAGHRRIFLGLVLLFVAAASLRVAFFERLPFRKSV